MTDQIQPAIVQHRAMHFAWNFNTWEKPVSHLADLLKVLGLYCVYQVVGRTCWCDRHPSTYISKVEVKFLFPNLYCKANYKSFSPDTFSTKSSLHGEPCWMTLKPPSPFNSFQFINIYPDCVVLAIESAVITLWLSLDQTINRHCSWTYEYGMSIFSLLYCNQNFELTLLLPLILLVLMEKCHNVKPFLQTLIPDV